MSRNKKGQFTYKPFKNSNPYPMFLMIGIMSLGSILQQAYAPVELFNPLGEPLALPPSSFVLAAEPEVDPKDVLVDKLYNEYKTNKDIIRKIVYAWGPVEGPRAVRVSFCESSHNIKAQHPISSSGGLFGIINGTWKGYHCTGDKYNPDDSISCAYKIYQANGWESSSSWQASIGCWGK